MPCIPITLPGDTHGFICMRDRRAEPRCWADGCRVSSSY